MEPPTCNCSTIHYAYTRQLPRADPNICSPTTLQHLNTTLVYSFNLKCIVYKSKKEITLNFIFCKYLAIYIKFVPTQAWHSDINARHVIISMLMEC
jgi:hypothetical protein